MQWKYNIKLSDLTQLITLENPNLGKNQQSVSFLFFTTKDIYLEIIVASLAKLRS